SLLNRRGRRVFRRGRRKPSLCSSAKTSVSSAVKKALSSTLLIRGEIVKAERVGERQIDARAVRVAARAPRWAVPLVKALLVVADMARVFKAIAIGSLLIVAAAFMYRGGVAYRTFSYSRGIFLLDFFLALASVGLVRTLLRTSQILVRRRGINLIPTLIVGRGA